MKRSLPRGCRLACLLAIALIASGPALAQGNSRTKPPDPPSLPANAWLAFESQRDLWISNGVECGMLLDGNVHGQSPPAWAPDGTELACWRTDDVTGLAGIYRVAADGTGTPQLVHTAAGNSVYGLDWSGYSSVAGGELLLFSEGFDLYVMRPDGTGCVRLTDDGSWARPRWSPDGTRIVASEFDANSDPMQRLAVLDLQLVSGEIAVTQCTYLTGVPGLPLQDYWASQGSFSPDGQWVVTVVDRASEFYLYRIDVNDPSNVVMLYHTSGIQMMDPVFTNDGNEVLYSHRVRSRDLMARLDAWGASSEPTFLFPKLRREQRWKDVRPE